MDKNLHKAMLVIGVGNTYRSDDAAGLLVARLLREHLSEVAIQETSGEGATLIEQWQKAGQVWLIDAVASGAAPGSIHRMEAHEQPIPAALFHGSTHDFGVAQAIEMARVLGTLPPRLVLYGIEGRCFDFGTTLSPEVEQAAHEVAWRVRQEIEQAQAGGC
jgi:hydrogenase maturation protease